MIGNEFTQTAVKFRILRCLTTAAVILVLCTAGCGDKPTSQAEPREVWRFAIEESAGSVQHQYALRFQELIEDRTDGEVEVVIYPYGSLGTSTQITEQLNLGVIEFAMASPGSLGKFIPEMQAFLLHFVLPQDQRQSQQLLSDPKLLAFLDTLYAPKGLKLLSIFSEGEMAWTMKQEVRRPEDFQGLKMRVMTSPILLSAYAAYGASPTPMPYSEVYSALQLNMIDGQVNPVFAIERQKFHEVTSWLIFPSHATFITTCAANRPFIEGLPPERQKLIANVMMELDEYIFKVQTKLQSERLKAIVQDAKRRQTTLNVAGDVEALIGNLTSQERLELIEDNPYLNIAPPLSDEEVSAFRTASDQAIDVFLQIGGAKGRDLLNRLRSTSIPPMQSP